MIKISLLGASGRMGGAVLASFDASMNLVDAVEHPDSPQISNLISSVHHFYEGDQVFTDKLSQDCDVVVDFAAGEGMGDMALLCAERGWALVSGRTGVSDEDQSKVQEAAKKTAVLHAGNMSLGANLLMRLSALAVKALPDADIEITEVHHRFKKDAPSGTALMLAQSVAEAANLTKDNYIYGREGETGERSRDEIAIHSIRSGDTVGDHSVTLGLLGERIELSHRAHDRKIFARGALQASKWIVGKPPGYYSMVDVLGL